MVIKAGGNVGIGTTSPQRTLDVQNDGLVIIGTGSNTEIMLRERSGTLRNLGAFHISIRPDVGGNNDNLKFLRFNAGSFQDISLVIDNTNGNVGIGSTAPAFKLDVSGTIRATGDVIAYSDARVKENIVTLENSLDLVQKLRGVRYNRIGESEKKIGVIAQEVLEILPEVVQQDQDGNYSVAYGNMAGLFIESIKQQQDKIQTLEARISVLEQLLRQKL
jgi:hypothetical protein